MAIFTAIAGFAASVGTWFAGLGVVTQSLVQIGAGLALNALSAALAGKPAPLEEPGIVGELQQGADIPRSFVMGRRAVPGSLAYHNQWGDQNEFYTRITALCDLPITDLVEVWVDGKLYQLDKANPHADFGWPIIGLTETRTENRRIEIGTNEDRGTTIYGFEEVEVSEVIGWVRFFDGTQTETAGFVVNDVATQERPWAAEDVGVGVANAVTTFKLNRDVFQGLPEILFVCDGIAMFDPASDAMGHSENPIVMARTVLAGLSYGGQWFYGPEQSSRFDTAELIGEIGKCNVPVPGADQMTASQRISAFGADIVPARYRASLEVPLDRAPADVIEDLLSACNGRASEVGTRYRLQVGDPGASIASITDADILSTAGQTFAPFFPLAETVNGITATYPAPSEGWQQQDAPPLYRPDLEGEDGGRRLPTGVSLPAVPFPEQVQRLMASALAEARRARRHSFVLPAEFWRLEPGDFLSFSSDRNGYDAKQFRIDGVNDLPNGDLAVDLTEVDPSDYDWSAATAFRPLSGGARSGVSVQPPAVAGWDLQPITITGEEDGVERPGLVMLWDAPAAQSVDGLEYQVRQVVGRALVAENTVTDVTLGLANVPAVLVRNTSYEARARYVTRRDTKWSDWVTARTLDIRLGGGDFGPDFFDQFSAQAQAAFDSGLGVLYRRLNRVTRQNIGELSAAIIERARIEGEVKQNKVDATAELDDAKAEFAQEYVSAVTDTSATVQFKTTLNTEIAGGISAGTSAISTAISGPDGAIANYEFEAGAKFKDLGAHLSTTYLAEANLESALAVSSSTVGTTLGNLVSSVTETAISVDGHKTIKGAVFNTNGTLSGFATTAEIQNGSPITTTVYDVDEFYIGRSNASGEFIAPFQQVGNVTRLQNVIAGTLQIEENAVIVPVASTRTDNIAGNGTWRTIHTDDITLSVPGSLLITWSGLHSYLAGAGTSYPHEVRLKIGNTVVQTRGGNAINDYPVLAVVVTGLFGYVPVAVEHNSNGLLVVKDRTISLVGIKR